jgi:triosephosphate isomerase
MLNMPVLFINFKTYEEATGPKAAQLAKFAEAEALAQKASIVLVVQTADIRLVSNAVDMPVFAQHVDAIEYGAHTGHILPESVRLAGATGTVLNHAEHKLDDALLEKTIARAHDAGLQVMACAETVERAVAIATFEHKPELIAIEPPELIGGKVSVSEAKPEIITDAVEKIHAVEPEIAVITGAGIHTAEDVRKALALGTNGVFVASGIVKASDQRQAIRELLQGFLEE